MPEWNSSKPPDKPAIVLAVVLFIVALLLLIFAFPADAITANNHSWSRNDIKRGLLCIHKHEIPWGEWRGRKTWSNPKYNPGKAWGYYRGGLQFNADFERTYGSVFLRRFGRADNWPIWAQIKTATRGAIARGGFNPWPRTGRMCGLPMFW